jgi:hypothetical protein
VLDHDHASDGLGKHPLESACDRYGKHIAAPK